MSGLVNKAMSKRLRTFVVMGTEDEIFVVHATSFREARAKMAKRLAVSPRTVREFYSVDEASEVVG